MSSPFAHPNTDRSTTLATHIKDLIETNKGTFTTPIEEVYYGKHTMTPKSPTVVVMSGMMDRSLQGVASPGGRTRNEITVLVDVMAADVLSGEQASRLAVDELAEDVEKLLHTYPNMDGLIIHGFVRRRDPGEVVISGSTWRAVRLTYVGTSLTYLSPPAAPV